MKRPSPQSLFVVSISYTATLDTIDKVMKSHMVFLEQYYAAGNFLVSGRKIPREGGIILGRAKNKKAMEKIMQADPFYKKGYSEMTITEFCASQCADDWKTLF